MRIPSNLISENLYTIGKEFIYADSYKEYQGYYYETSNKFFAGRFFDINAPRLLKLGSSEIDSLKLNPKTSVYANLNKTRIPTNKIDSIPLELVSGEKYVAKRINSNPIKIIFTTFKTWKERNKYPEYTIISIYFDAEFGFNVTPENIKAIPEIEMFLAEYSSRGTNFF